MISAISTDSSEVVSTSVPMSIPLMIRHSHAKTISAMIASRTLMMVSFVHDFNSFLFIIPDFSEFASLAQVSFGGADIFRLLYFIKSKAPFGNPAFGLPLSVFPFSSSSGSGFRTLPALTSPYISLNLHLAKCYHSLKSCRTPSPTAKSSICMIMHTYTDYQRFVI